MKVRVVVSFVDKGWYTRSKGFELDLDEAYATELIEQGKVVQLDDQPTTSNAKSSKRKASKKSGRKTN